MAGEEGVEERTDDVALVLVEEVGGLEGEPEPLVLGQAGLIAEHEEVGRGRQGGGQLRDDPEGGLVRPGLVAAELAEMHPGALGQSGLGQSPLTAQLGQALWEGHGDHDTRPPLVCVENNRYSQLYTRTISDREDDVASRMKTRRVPDDVVALEVDSEAPDAVLLDAVVGHWHACLMASDERDAILSSLGVSVAVAERLRIGLSDRTLGLRLPDRQWKAGLALRSRLTDFGVLRESGHEAFRGCVIVPIVDGAGTVVGVFGRRIDRTRAEGWADGLPGGLFHGNGSDTPLLVVSSIPDALAVIGAGHGAVLSPGRRQGFSADDLATLAARHDEVVIAGRGSESFAAQLTALGMSVLVAAPDVPLTVALGSAPVPGHVLDALLADRRLFASPADVGGTRPAAVTPPSSSESVFVTEGRDEVFVHRESRSWRVRGAGARANCEGELLRVALSVTDSGTGRFHLDTLDLYAARQRSSFLDAAVIELRADRVTLAPELAEVIALAERRRDEASAAKTAPPPAMTDVERAEAMELLSAPDLLERLGADLAALGVVGEQTNLLVCYLATISRLCERPFGVLVQASSAAGKSTLTDAVCSLVPPEDLVALSAITSQALYYLGGDGLARKVLAVAEEQGAAAASYALKLLVSEGRLAIASTGKDRTTGRLSTASYEIAGPVALVMTTTATDIDPELENRLVVLGVDEGATQTQAIVNAQRAGATLAGLLARTARQGVRRLHVNAQRLLAPFPVVIPEMEADFPTTATRHRRDHAKAQSIISALTLLHQHQREHKTATVDGTTLTYLEATPDDIERGLALARVVLVRGSDHLAPQSAHLLQSVIDHVTARASAIGCELTEVGVTRRELRELLGWSDKQVRAATDRLVALEYLVVAGGGRGRCRTYNYVPGLGELRPGPSPIGPRPGRTTNPGQAGETAQVARFARLGEAQVPPVEDVVKDDEPVPGNARR